MKNILNEYRFNRKFREYVDEYCNENDISVEDALNQEKVKNIYRYYTEV